MWIVANGFWAKAVSLMRSLSSRANFLLPLTNLAFPFFSTSIPSSADGLANPLTSLADGACLLIRYANIHDNHNVSAITPQTAFGMSVPRIAETLS